jgi:16S rRNA (adenine1518-N6/adenine1519-N6)-dimethyltransferase
MQKYGQHFLVDANVIAQIVDAACLLCAENVVEIGPGKGALTRELSSRGVPLTAVEIDPEMVRYLQKNLPAGVRVVQQNFLEFDLAALPPVPTEFVSNLPYIDAAAILDKVLGWKHFKTAIFMFQKEQAQKIRAKAGDELYGPLSIFSQLRARISPICKVGRSSFAPPPKVESAVLSFEKITPPQVDWEKLRRVVTAAFLHRRKTLLNALMLGGYEKEKIMGALTVLGVPPTVRPEQLTPQQYAELTLPL